ncbi:hypothetical protein RV134_310326 [Roseovarius sp. EC-HK134]|nr:hypothetical protein RV420_360432 [Roseovarius sp. EC-SD190]VVT21320.1 hypothetical protein RV134_310326 [Roseovarius sp. EC-HK134]
MARRVVPIKDLTVVDRPCGLKALGDLRITVSEGLYPGDTLFALSREAPEQLAFSHAGLLLRLPLTNSALKRRTPNSNT